MSEPIFRVKLYEDVADRITARIRTAQWRAGERLPPEAELAKEFDVSRSTVREAIRSLQRTGLIRSKAGSGSYVAPNAPVILQTRELAAIMGDREHLHDLVQTRYILEPQMAALAAAQATDEEKRHLCYLVDRMAEQTERFELMAAGHAFHMELARLSHNVVLDGFYRSAADQLRSMRVLDSLTEAVYRDGIEEHRQIAQAVAAGDAAGAKQLMKAHLKKDYGAYLQDTEE
ncbi:MAG: FadR family transcriptional regulator [Oscillospiraceae bacterium]|nr:FadR family transcriptional regulator [Oscillospiraceae bacterium]